MKCVILSMTAHSGPRFRDISHFGAVEELEDPCVEIEAQVRLFGTPEQAQNLMHSGRAMEIIPDAEGFKKAKPDFSDIKKGDEVRYKFIRSTGDGPEESQWMKVIGVRDDMITAVWSQEKYKNRYEFRVLRCQIIEHKSGHRCVTKKSKQKKEPKPEVWLDGQKVEIKLASEANDPVAALRKQVQEFNLE